MDSSPKQQITLEIPYRETISRLFIFRGLWVFILMWPLMVWALWMSIIMMLQFWHMLILGKRHQGLFNRYVRFTRYTTRWQAYFKYLVDERPEFVE